MNSHNYSISLWLVQPLSSNIVNRHKRHEHWSYSSTFEPHILRLRSIIEGFPLGLRRNEFLTFHSTLPDIHKPQESRAEGPPTYSTLALCVKNEMPKKGTYNANKNANGMLSLFPEAVMIAEETRGPMNADVLPTYSFSVRKWVCWENRARLVFTTENKAKNKNIWGKGDTSLIIVWL